MHPEPNFQSKHLKSLAEGATHPTPHDQALYGVGAHDRSNIYFLVSFSQLIQSFLGDSSSELEIDSALN